MNIIEEVKYLTHKLFKNYKFNICKYKYKLSSR